MAFPRPWADSTAISPVTSSSSGIRYSPDSDGLAVSSDSVALPADFGFADFSFAGFGFAALTVPSGSFRPAAISDPVARTGYSDSVASRTALAVFPLASSSGYLAMAIRL